MRSLKSIRPILVVYESLLELLLGVQYEGSSSSDRLVYGLSCKQDKSRVSTCRLEAYFLCLSIRDCESGTIAEFQGQRIINEETALMDKDHRVPSFGYLMSVARAILHVKVEIVCRGVSLNGTFNPENFATYDFGSDLLVLVNRDLRGLELLVPRLAEFILFLKVDPQLEPECGLGEAHGHL